jgi:hypothetical protein
MHPLRFSAQGVCPTEEIQLIQLPPPQLGTRESIEQDLAANAQSSVLDSNRSHPSNTSGFSSVSILTVFLPYFDCLAAFLTAIFRGELEQMQSELDMTLACLEQLLPFFWNTSSLHHNHYFSLVIRRLGPFWTTWTNSSERFYRCLRALIAQFKSWELTIVNGYRQRELLLQFQTETMLH